MPIYEYRRPNGTTFEVMQKMSDEPLTEDPETGVPVVRVSLNVGVALNERERVRVTLVSVDVDRGFIDFAV